MKNGVEFRFIAPETNVLPPGVQQAREIQIRLIPKVDVAIVMTEMMPPSAYWT